ncbi:hypothetical protein ScPMuIL_007387 [Solemya velum]
MVIDTIVSTANYSLPILQQYLLPTIPVTSIHAMSLTPATPLHQIGQELASCLVSQIWLLGCRNHGWSPYECTGVTGGATMVYGWSSRDTLNTAYPLLCYTKGVVSSQVLRKTPPPPRPTLTFRRLSVNVYGRAGRSRHTDAHGQGRSASTRVYRAFIGKNSEFTSTRNSTDDNNATLGTPSEVRRRKLERVQLLKRLASLGTVTSHTHLAEGTLFSSRVSLYEVGDASECSLSGEDLVVAQGTTCQISQSQTYGSISIDGTVEISGQIHLTSSSTVSVGGTGTIDANFQGGTSSGSEPFGGSHGGRGGNIKDSYLSARDALPSGNYQQPEDVGGGGGSSCGGRGGGAVTITASGDIEISGYITANGEDAGSGDCGGGAGGSIYITSGGQISGSGIVMANGGRGSGSGGGGGGGRVAFHHLTSSITSMDVRAHGGLPSDSAEVTASIGSLSDSGNNGHTAASYGRISSHSSYSWRARTANTNQYMTAVLSTPQYITAIDTRGHPHYNYWVKTYQLQYYNGSWVTYPDILTGNTDSSSIVHNRLKFPVYASQIRIRPQTWRTGIGLAIGLYGYQSGGAGGPGTVYLLETSEAGVGTLVINNMGMNPLIKQTDDCEDWDVVTSGAAAWISTENENDLDIIVLSHGSHLVVNADTTVSEVFGDDTSMIHTVPQSTLRLGRTLASNAAIYAGAVLQFTDGSDITLDRDLNIKGTVDFVGLIKLTIAGDLILQVQDFVLEELTIDAEATMTVIGNDTFNVWLTKFSVSGIFEAGALHFGNITEFFVSSEGEVTFEPASSGEHLGSVIQIDGTVELGRHVSIFHPCQEFSIDGGILSWPHTDETMVLDCTDVDINGEWKPGNLSFPGGLDTLSVGPQGVFHFTAVGPILTDSFSVAGEVHIANVAEFMSKNASDERIEIFIVHSPDGELRINTDNLPYVVAPVDSPVDSPEDSDLSKSTRDQSDETTRARRKRAVAQKSEVVVEIPTANHIRAKYFTVGGVLEAKDLIIDPGFDMLYIEKTAEFTFKPKATFEVYEMKVNGLMDAGGPISLKGTSDEQVHEVIVGTEGVLRFDSTTLSNQDWTNASTFSVNSFFLYGEFHAGLMQNHFSSDTAWTTFEMNGTMTFDPQEDFLCNTMSVDGTITVYNPVSILSDSSVGMYFLIKSRGKITLDQYSQTANGLDGPWADNSNITADNFIMESGGRFDTGSAKWEIKSATIGGQINSYSLESVEIKDLTITSTGNVKFHYTTEIDGTTMTTEASSVLNLAYQFAPTDTTSGSRDSLINMRSVTIGGQLTAGSLVVDAEVLAVSGSITTSGGGYLSGTGEGAGAANSGGGSGGSYGGRGGKGNVIAGMPYGDIYSQTTWGSGGGEYTSSHKGGRGGGRIHLVIQNNLTVSGSLRSDGLGGSTHAGGGSGGSVWVQCEMFVLTGHIYCNGGNGASNGGGGAGGRINVFFETGTYETGHVEAKGGSGREPGGPGIAYFENDNVRQIRVDNKCQMPTVTEPAASLEMARQDHYNTYVSTGAIAYLRPATESFEFDFTLMELYGNAHLTFLGNNTRVKAFRIVGDDSAHLHVAPYHTLEITETNHHRMINVTYHPYIYENAKWILPESQFVIRESLDEKARGINSNACPTANLNSANLVIWGTFQSYLAHIVVASGGILTFAEGHNHQILLSNLTIEERGTVDLRGTEQWDLRVKRNWYNGHVIVEYKGLVKAVHLKVTTDYLLVNNGGHVTMSTRGLIGGDGGEIGASGGSYGGFGGNRNSFSDIAYGSIYEPVDFGSSGNPSVTTSGVGGGILDVEAEYVVCEGIIQSDGQAGTSGVGGGSGGSIIVNTRVIEGSGSIQAMGGNGGSNFGGGGGGRIAVSFMNDDWWRGVYRASGGTSSMTNGFGGAGTVFLKDTTPGAQNETLIINNFNIGSLSGAEKCGSELYKSGTTWVDRDVDRFDELQLLGGSYLLMDEIDANKTNLDVMEFKGDHSGTLVIGPDQTIVVQHTEDSQEFLMDAMVCEGGTLILPDNFKCFNNTLRIWGTLGVYNMEVGYGCKLLLGDTGTTRHIDWTTIGTKGTYSFNNLDVTAGGEVTVTADLTGEESVIKLEAETVHIYGEGLIHAMDVTITADNVIVDDLGHLVGDLHSVACEADIGSGNSGNGASGAGHAGRGGRGSGQDLTGAAIGQLFDPDQLGCSGGSSQGAGGLGGGVIRLTVNKMLQNDGHIRCNGGAGKSGAGGGSGGTINIHTDLMKGFGRFQVSGGSGSTYSNYYGGGGSAGRIAIFFARNETFSGSFDACGGEGGATAGDGAAGTSYFYHTVHSHSTLLLDNCGRGPISTENVIDDYGDLTRTQTHTWFLPEHAEHAAGDDGNFHFHELQIYGQAQLAIQPLSSGGKATLLFDNMIGDRTGAIHVGGDQEMDLEREHIDLPFSVHVYPGALLGLAPDTVIHGVEIFLNGTLTHVVHLTIHHEGKLWLFKEGRTENLDASHYYIEFVYVKNGGYLHMITDPVFEPAIDFETINLNVDGGGLVRGTYVQYKSVNMTVEAAGILSADGLGYEVADGVGDGKHGRINPGRTPKTTENGAGAGHGGSGGQGSHTTVVGFAYDDIYYPTHFGSAGGGSGGGAGGGRIWIDVTDTLHIDGVVTASGLSGQTKGSVVGGGGSGGSIVIHCNVINGFGLVLTRGGNGSTYTYNSNVYEGGGGAGGRLAMYLMKNMTFYDFRFQANGGLGGGCVGGSQTCLGESGGPGTIFLYHTDYNHTTLIIDNEKAPRPKIKYVDYTNIYKSSARAWIMPQSGLHKFAGGEYYFSFHELQIYGNGDFAVVPPELANPDDGLYPMSLVGSTNFAGAFIEPVEVFFKYMIGDRTGAVHIGHEQEMDLIREEIDLPFSCYVYTDGYLGLAPITVIHGVEIHLAGTLANVLNITLHHNGYLWLKNGGHTLEEVASSYWFESIRIQHSAVVNASTDPVADIGITFNLTTLFVECGGLLHGTHFNISAENVTVDGYGKIAGDELGYNTGHTDALHGSSSQHGVVNPGLPASGSGQGGGGSHGGMGGIGKVGTRVGPANDDIYEPYKIGSAGGAGVSGAHGGAGGGVIWINVTDTLEIDGEISVSGADAGADGGGGGAGGSIMIYCNTLKGYGEITAHGGAGSSHASSPGVEGVGAGQPYTSGTTTLSLPSDSVGVVV